MNVHKFRAGNEKSTEIHWIAIFLIIFFNGIMVPCNTRYVILIVTTLTSQTAPLIFKVADLVEYFLMSIPSQTEEKRQALLRAFDKHNKLMDEAQNGKGM